MTEDRTLIAEMDVPAAIGITSRYHNLIFVFESGANADRIKVQQERSEIKAKMART